MSKSTIMIVLIGTVLGVITVAALLFLGNADENQDISELPSFTNSNQKQKQKIETLKAETETESDLISSPKLEEEKQGEDEVDEPPSLGTTVSQRETWEPLTSEEMDEIISDGVRWLKTAQEPNGHFRYEYSVLADSNSTEDLTVRQTGALYVLGEVLRKGEGDRYNLRETIQNAIAYFKENSYSGELEGKQFQCVLRNSQVCSLGATSLTIIGILDLLEKYPELETIYEKQLLELVNFVLAVKKPDEGYQGYFRFNGPPSNKESDFSNGEAVLALVRYYAYSADEEIKRVIDDSFDYFQVRYSPEWNFNFYLWGMAAIKELQEIQPTFKYNDFVKGYTDWRISSYKNRRSTLGNVCAYIEGVIAAYSVLEPNLDEKEKSRYLEEINFWLVKSKKLQVGNGETLQLQFGDTPTNFIVYNPDRAAGGFLTGLYKPFQRIDYTQHCVSSYLQKLVDIDGETL